jgi:hypothetical protein
LYKHYGYNLSRFTQLLNDIEPIQTAIKLVRDPKFHEGFTKLWELGRLDLTVEAIILRNPFNQLFSPEVLHTARERLGQLGYIET